VSWFKKDEKDTEGKTEVGKTPPENKDQSKSEADLLIERLGVTIEAKLKPLADQVSAIDKWRTDLTALAEKKPPAEKKEGETEKRVTLEEASLSPEAEALWARQNLGPIASQTVTISARLTERECLDSLGPEFDFLKPDIRKIFDEQTPITRKAGADYPAYCSNVVKMVIGDAALKAGLKADGKSRRFFLEDGSSKDQGKTEGFEPSEIETLRKLKIDPKEFSDANKVTH
jgi:hypothetical protein